MEFHSFLRKTLNNLNSFKKVVSSSLTNKGEEISSQSKLLQIFENYERDNLIEYVNNDDSKLIFFSSSNCDIKNKIVKAEQNTNNPFVCLKEYLTEEILDVSGMIEALDAINNLHAMHDKLIHKIEKLDTEIAGLKVGQKNFFKGLFKNNEQLINKAQTDKTTSELNSDIVREIVKIASFTMENYIDTFKSSKSNSYYKTVKYFSIIQQKNEIETKSIWNDVKISLQKVNNK